jgi:hypothetical protein
MPNRETGKRLLGNGNAEGRRDGVTVHIIHVWALTVGYWVGSVLGVYLWKKDIEGAIHTIVDSTLIALSLTALGLVSR